MYLKYLPGGKQAALFQACILLITMHCAAAAESPDRITALPSFDAEQLAAWVLDANPGLAAIQAAADASSYRIDPAGSLDDPVLSYGVAPRTIGAHRRLNYKVDISQTIPWPGTLAAREAVARHEADAANQDVEALRLGVIAQAKSAYAEWRFVSEALSIHHATQTLLDELIATAQTRYAAGRAAKQDVLQAELERSQLDNHELQLLRQQATMQAHINSLLNRAPDSPLPEATAISLTASPPSLDALQTRALHQHPELARLDALVSARNKDTTLAEKAFYPDFHAGIGYNGLWNDVDQRPIFSVSINIPLDRNKRKSELNRARADARRSAWIRVERRAKLLAELAQSRAQVIEAESSVRLYRNQLVPLAIEYLATAIADYQSGSGGFLNVITAEQRKLDTELALARARADYLRHLAALERWLGASIDSVQQTSKGTHK